MFPDGTTDQTIATDTTSGDATNDTTTTDPSATDAIPSEPFVKDSTVDAASSDGQSSTANDGVLNTGGNDTMTNTAASGDVLGDVAFGSLAVWTHHNDNANTGANLNETILTTANVNKNSFGRLCDRVVDGQIYAQILYVSNVSIPNKGTHNVVYVATMANSVYAYDADDTTANAQPLWHVTLHPSIQLPDPGIAGGGGYNDIAVEIGILSTPVISLDNHAIYVVAATKDAGGYAHYLHALDLSTGNNLFGGPVKLQGSVKGTGYKGERVVNGQIAFTSNKQNQRAALLLANGNVYIAFAAYEDSDPYHGWIMAYDAKTLKQVAIYNTTPNGGEGGIWQAGRGPAADDQGNVYVLTGNGSTDTQNGSALSDSLIKFNPHLQVIDWFTPYNFQDLSGADSDVGSSGPMLLPGTNFVVGGGKEGKVFLFDSQKLGKFVSNTNNNSQIPQWFYVTSPDDLNRPYVMDYGKTHHLHAGPVCWTGPMGMWIYVWPETDVLKAFQFKNGRFITVPMPPKPLPPNSPPPGNNAAGTGNHPIPFPGGFLGALASKAINLQQGDTTAMPGGALSISANGSQAGTGIVWASHPHNLDFAHQVDANQHVVAGILHAYNAENLTQELWNSEMTPGDSIGNFAKFNAPTIANGKVYLASFGRGFVKQNAALTAQDRTNFKATHHFSVYGLKK